jgi:hypothetical protein
VTRHRSKRTYDRSRERINYAPLDALLDRPEVRLLRALRHFDWAPASDLYIALDVPHEDSFNRNVFETTLYRSIKAGFARRRGPRNWTEYQLTKRGLRHLEQRLAVDMGTEFAPARPGTEALLCA